jgi:hypothetical protein
VDRHRACREGRDLFKGDDWAHASDGVAMGCGAFVSTE